MHPSYHQSKGNPLQVHRLPKQKLQLELQATGTAAYGDGSLVAACPVLWALAAVPLGYLLSVVDRTTWLAPIDVVLVAPAILFVAYKAIRQRSIRALLHPALGLALIAFAMNGRVVMPVDAVLLGGLMGMLTYSFGHQWLVLSTAVPVDRDEALRMRQRGKQYLMLAASIIAVQAMLAVTFRATMLQLGLLAMPLLALFLPKPRELRRNWLKVYTKRLKVWLQYDPIDRPGLMPSPAGPLHYRAVLLSLVALLTAMGLVRVMSNSLPATTVTLHQPSARSVHSLSPREPVAEASIIKSIALVVPAVALVFTIPVLLPLAIVIGITSPILLEVAACRNRACSKGMHSGLYESLRRSSNRIERESIYLGRVAADGTPVLIPKKLFNEHAHALGDSGAGKTSLFLCPLIEQLAYDGDCSVIVLDLKADSLELLASLQAASERAAKRGRHLPLKCFSNQRNKPSFAFNPLAQSYWSNFDLRTKTDILCGANGLNYGTDYGQGYYSSANAAILHQAMKTFPHVNTFTELADCIGEVITTAKRSELHPEIRKAGVHVHEVIKRLGHCASLNVTAQTNRDPQVLEQAIDLADFFERPQLLYCHLSSTLSPMGAPEIGRLFNYMLLAAATQCRRKHPVYLVIDEFQRMVASNLEYMLQLARSMGVGVILANQSMQDLRKATTNLINPVESNCRIRQWFAVSSADDQLRLIRSSGMTVDTTRSESYQDLSGFACDLRITNSERVVPRLDINDVLMASDHPFQSILRVSRGDGYAQFGGMPFVLQSYFHITAEEYRRRRRTEFPFGPGSFIAGIDSGAQSTAAGQPNAAASEPPRAKPTAPTWSEEVIGDAPSEPLSEAETRQLDELFKEFRSRGDDTPKPSKPPRKRKGKDQ